MKNADQSLAADRLFLPSEACYLSWITALAEWGDELRAERVQRIKQQIMQGTYDVGATEVAREIARSELSWFLSMDYASLHDTP